MDLGQNFLVDGNVKSKIVNLLSDTRASCVFEIGTGHGELTEELCKVSEKVVSIEIDSVLFDYSSLRFGSFSGVEIVNADFMSLDLDKFVNSKFGSKKVSVCANIPYYITSQIVMRLLESERFSFIVLMVQKEAAERIICTPGERGCGAISAAVRYYSIPCYSFTVSKNCFRPRPKVDSAVITFSPVKRDDIKNRDIFFKVVRSAFSKRRKTVVNSISSSMGIDKGYILEILKSLGISENSRAENLTFENFVDISNLMGENN